MYRNDLLQRAYARVNKDKDQVKVEADVSVDTVNRAFRGDPTITVRRLLAIAAAVELPKRDLFDDSIEVPAETETAA